MNYLFLKEKTTERELLVNPAQVSSVSFNTLMNSIVVDTINGKFQCSKVMLVDQETAQAILNHLNELIKDDQIDP